MNSGKLIWRLCFLLYKFQVVSTLLLVASCSASHLYGAVSSQYHNQDHLGQYEYGYSEPNSAKHEVRLANGVTHGGYSYVDGHGLVQSVKYASDPIHGFHVAGTNLPSSAHSIVAPAHGLVVSHAAPIVHSAPVVHAVSHSYASHAAPLSHGLIAGPYAHGIVGHGVPHDTPEVAAAKLAHFAAHAEARAAHHLYKRSAWGGQSWNHAPAPVIHNGVPVETPEVQQAKAAHAAAHAAVQSHAPAHYAPAAPAWNHGPAAPSWNHQAQAPAPQIHNGVPVETPEVQHAKAAHFAAVAEAQSRSHSAPAHHHHHAAPAHYAPVHHQGSAYHIPVIQNGVPVETPEVQHAKAAHFAAVAEAQSHSGHNAGSWHGDNSWNHGHNDW